MSTEIQDLLTKYVLSYMAYQQAMQEDAEDDRLSEALEDYFLVSAELCVMLSALTGNAEELPDLSLFFDEKGAYSPFAVSFNKALLGSGQLPEGTEWRCEMMIFIGELLKEIYE